jgi:hypothetical protein
VLALFFAIHSITVASTAWGAPAFVRIATAVGPARGCALGVLAFVLLLVDRLDDVREARRMGAVADARNAGLAERATGWIALMWVGGQLWSGAYAVASLRVPAQHVHARLMAQLSSTGVAGVPWAALGEVVAMVALVFFLQSRAGATATHRTRTALRMVGVMVVLFPLNGVLYLATGSRAMGPSRLTLDAQASPCGSGR